MPDTKKAFLMILDGWGKGDHSASDAVFNANTPFIDSCYKRYPNSNLITFGESVGLPKGQMGNSEVGHLNIGAGRIVYQNLAKINNAIENKSFFEEKTLKDAFNYAKKNDKPVHLMGLVSPGGIHSHQNHLKALCEMAKNEGVEKVYVHAFSDGRDCSPTGGNKYLSELIEFLNRTQSGELASLIGRYYAMDRDNRWQRIKLAYDQLIKGEGKKTKNIIEALDESYKEGVTDEFVKPIVKTDDNENPIGIVQSDDVLICFNFRTDRCRQISIALTQKDLPEYDMHAIPLYYVTMTNYDKSFENIKVVYEKADLPNTLGEYVSNQGLRQIRIAETEKYPHVTFFFSGGREVPFKNEKRILIHSPKVATYDLQPEMSAEEVTQAILKEVKDESADFVCLNFANPDMVGHTGVYDAIVKAVEKIDNCASRIVEEGLKHDYNFIIIADHGNAEKTLTEDGKPHTAHTTNLVHCIVIDNEFKKVDDGILADVAPTILTMMHLKQPEEMTGKSLI